MLKGRERYGDLEKHKYVCTCRQTGTCWPQDKHQGPKTSKVQTEAMHKSCRELVKSTGDLVLPDRRLPA